MKTWNSLVVSLWSGKYEKPTPLGDNVKCYKTFGNHDMVTIASVEGDTATEILRGMWEQTNNYSQNINAGESIHNLFAVANNIENNYFWCEDSPYLFLSAIQINYEDETNFEEQLKNFKMELIKFLKNENFIENKDFSLYNSLDCGDILLFLKSDSYEKGSTIIQQITMKSKQNHYSYSVCGMNTELISQKIASEDEIIPKVVICSILSDATHYNTWFSSFIKEYPVEISLKKQERVNSEMDKYTSSINNMSNNEEYVHLSRLGNEDFCINIYNCKMSHFIKMINECEGVFSQQNELVKIVFSKLRIQFDSNIYDIKPAVERTPIEGKSVINYYNPNYQVLLRNIANPYVTKALAEILAATENLEKKRFAFDIQDCIRNVFPLFVNKIANYNNIKTYYSNSNFNNDLILFTTGLMSIANGSLHADKLFISVPGFNAVTCDVPAKLLVYYTAFIQKLVDVLNNENIHKYKFLLCPDLYLGIEVIPLFEYEKNDSQLLKARVPIKKLFDPQNLLMELSHEVAHFVGSSARRRENRIDFLANAIAYTFADRLVRPKVFEKNMFSDETEISENLESCVISTFALNFCNEWSIDNALKNEWKSIPLFIKKHLLNGFDFNNDNILYLDNVKKKFIDNSVKLFSASESDSLLDKVYTVIVKNVDVTPEIMDKMYLLTKIIERHLNELLLDEYTKIIDRICQLASESFADLVMLCITQDPIAYLKNIYLSEKEASYKKNGEDVCSWDYYLVGEMRIERIISVLTTLNYDIEKFDFEKDDGFNIFLKKLKNYTNEENEYIRATSISSLESICEYLSLCLKEILLNKDELDQLKELYKLATTSSNLDDCIRAFRKSAFDFRENLINDCFKNNSEF